MARSEVFPLVAKRVGIVVDGDGDYASLRTRFHDGYKVLKTDGPRGHNAPTAEIAKKSRKQIGILAAYGCGRVIVVLDFEERTKNYDEFIEELIGEFTTQSFSVPVSVAVPNKMIENWFLADIQFLAARKGFLRDGIGQRNYEGTNGKKELKQLMKPGLFLYRNETRTAAF